MNFKLIIRLQLKVAEYFHTVQVHVKGIYI